jgi:Initiator Replication protein
MSQVRTHAPTIDDEVPKRRIIRQPYRITMAMWNGDIHQKRILTAIIASLQREMASIEQGAAFCDLSTFATKGNCAIIEIPMKLLNPSGNNYSMVHKALKTLEENGVELWLPEVKGRKGPSVQEQQMVFRLKKLPGATSRAIRLKIEKSLLMELLRTSSGLSCLSLDVMFRLRSTYALKLYEILSHWKDRETLKVSLDQLRGWLGAEGKMSDTRIFLRKILHPACHQLRESADVYADFETERTANRISHIKFFIREQKNRETEESIIMKLRDQIEQVLRIRFKWKEEQFQQIRHLLHDPKNLRFLNEKIARLWRFHDQNTNEVKHLAQWSLSALLKEEKENRI